MEARITGLDNAVGELNNIYESLSGDEKFVALFLKALQDFWGFPSSVNPWLEPKGDKACSCAGEDKNTPNFPSARYLL